MASKIPEGMLCELVLTPDETLMIVDEAERVIAEALAVNELFLANDRVLPKSEWKLVKSREKIQVFRKRKDKSLFCGGMRSSNSSEEKRSPLSSFGRARSDTSETASVSSIPFVRTSVEIQHSSSSASSVGSGFDGGSEMNARKSATTPLIIATGIIAGTIEDVAFGNLAYTERLTRYRDAHMRDEFAATKILATIISPTTEDPFQSLVIKWNTKREGPLSRNRDCVFIEANGIAISASGERVAYYLKHSIDNIPRIPGFKHLDIVRVNGSMCSISRQYDQSSVEVFCRGYIDLGGNITEGSATSKYTDMLLSMIHVVDCAYMKKLIWLTRVKREANLKVAASNLGSKPARHCDNCAASLSILGNLIHTGAACQACQQEICSKCSVPKKLTIEVSSSEMKSKTVTFCLHCVIEAKQFPTRQVAVTTMTMRSQAL